MKMVKKIPEVAGWYWARHQVFGLVITHVQIVDGIVHVMDNGYAGWNVLLNQFTEWSDSTIAEPIS